MSQIGLTIETGGHRWEVTAVTRTGPNWRIVLKAQDDPRCRMTTLTPPGDRPRTVWDVRKSFSELVERWFPDGSGEPWKVEPGPAAAPGSLSWLLFSAKLRAERVRVSCQGIAGLAALGDQELDWMLQKGRERQAEAERGLTLDTR